MLGADSGGFSRRLNAFIRTPETSSVPATSTPAPYGDRAACAAEGKLWGALQGTAAQSVSSRATFSSSLSLMVDFLCLAGSLVPYTEPQNYRTALLEEILKIIWFQPHCHRQIHFPLDQVAQSLDQRRLRRDLNSLFSCPTGDCSQVEVSLFS